MRIFRASIDDSEDEADEVSPMVEAFGEALGEEITKISGLPEDFEEALNEVDRSVARPTARYGTGENYNGSKFEPNVDEGAYVAWVRHITADIDGDEESPAVRVKLHRVEPGIFSNVVQFRAEIRVAIVNENGHPIDWNEPYYTEVRPKKMELAPLVADIIDTVAGPEIVSS